MDPLPARRALTGPPRSAELLRRYGAAQDLGAAGTCYGRVVPDGDAAYLQYWFFYVDNPCALDPGRHDGDWEFAQVRVARAGDGWEATHLTLDQHGLPETRSLPAGAVRPDVFVAVNSHASYFTPGTHPQFPLPDECDGAAPAGPLAVIAMPQDEDAWPRWRGQWGVDEGPGTWLARRIPVLPALVRLLNRRIPAGDSPRSPGRQPVSWQAGRCYRAGLRRRATSTWIGRLVHAVGRLTWPRAVPHVALEPLPDAEGVEVRVEPAGRGLRRVTRVAIALADAEGHRPLAAVTVRARERRAAVPVPPGARPVWRAAGYNVLRQRGHVVGPGV